ncbi:MAG: DUF1467 family protein [Hyphomonas sp.]|tara:strand:- start:6577 stop:6810 length:234 start_codon:yes stop_codon:yes gene_type:complete
MTIASGVVVFVMAWWISFFAVLPIGVRGQFEDGDITPGTEEGAPANPMLLKKVLWATIGGAIITGIAVLVVTLLLAD